MTMNTSETASHEIPPLPGGGSWRFNETTWAWDSNNPVPVDQPAAPAAAAEQAAAQPVTSEE
jgi:hypothetical protein